MTISEEFQACYGIEGDPESAIECAKKIIAREKGASCKPRLVLLTQEDCDVCASEKALRQKDIDAGLIHEINVMSKEGKEIVEKNDLDGVPAMLVVDCHNRMIG